MKFPVLAFALLPVAAAAAPVEVAFGDLAKFTDLRVSITTSDRDRQGLAEELRRHIEREAGPRLPPGTRLAVTITDVDMAGEYPPIAGPMSRDLRVVKEVYPPRIDLEFRLTGSDGRVAREGRRELRDAGFMWGVTPGTRETLAFEKALVDAWLRQEFAPAR
jgi:hypothetical protein